MLNERPTLSVAGLAVLSAILWGGNAVSLKLALNGIPPLGLAGVRFLLGGLVVSLYALLSRVSLGLRPGELRRLVVLGLLFFLQIYTFNTGIDLSLAGRTTVLVHTYPFFTALFAHLLLPGDRLSRSTLLGMALSFGGVIVLFAESLSTEAFRYLAGDLISIASAVLLGLRQIYTKTLTQHVHPAKVIVWQSALSVPAFLCLSALLERGSFGPVGAAEIAGLLYAALVVAGLGFVINTSLLRRYAASRITVFAFLSPVLGVLLSGLILHEPISPTLAASLVLVAAGITVVNVTGSARGRPCR